MTERYKIVIQSEVERDWSSWIDNLELSYPTEGHTAFIGDIADQAALHGLLARIRDLGIPILLVARLKQTNNQNI